MNTAAALRSIHRPAGGISYALPPFEKASLTAWSTAIRLSSGKRAGNVLSCSKKPEVNVSKSNVSLGQKTNGSTENHGLRNAAFSNAFEAMILEVCDETSIAELQIKVGGFEMHLKRSIGTTNYPVSVAPPIPSEPVVQSAPTAPSSSPKPSSEKATTFASTSSAVASKLSALEASGTDGYKLVTSPTVGSFRRGRTVKGKKQPPICKQGDIIKEGQVIGYINQFGTELPVKSDVAGEVLKILFDEGEAVGYGDPLIAVLPSFHGLNL